MTQGVSGGESSLVIERWLNTYFVPADHPAPGELKDRLDRIAAEELTAVCSRRLGAVMDEADPSVWLVREIELDLAFDANCDIDPGALAHVWGERVALQVARVIAAGEQGDSVLRFPNRAAYLARFVRDLAAGQAWGKWYYREFDSLRSLPAGAAIGEALVREPAKSSDVLVLLAGEKRLEDVLNALSDLDASRIYRSCSSSGSGHVSAGQERLWTTRLLQSWSGIVLGPASAAAISFCDPLRLFAHGRLQFAGVEIDGSFPAAIDGLLELRRILAGLGSATTAEEFLQAATTGDHERAARILDRAGVQATGDELEFIARVSRGQPDWSVRARVLVGTKTSDHPDQSTQELGHESFLTPFGGIFLLGPSFVELRIDDAVRAAVRACAEPMRAAPLIRHMLAVKCMGSRRAGEAIENAGLKTFAGVDFALSIAEIASVLAGADAEQALRQLAGTLAEQQRISAECLEASLIALPFGGNAILLRDGVTDEWIHATVLDERIRTPEAALECSLYFVRDVLDESPRTLLLGPGLAGLRDSEVCRRHAHWVAAFDSGAETDMSQAAAEAGARLGRGLRLARRSDPALEYFALSGFLPDLGLSSSQDLAWSLVARTVLKNFARRLIGFEASSPEHLFTNFLAGMSSVHVTPHSLEVLLPSSPLAVMLRLSGMHAEPYALPWCERREICLRAPTE